MNTNERTNERPTPETDAVTVDIQPKHASAIRGIVPAFFARCLERERDEARETLDLMCDEFQRIKAAPGCTSGIAGFCERAISGIKQRVPLIDQRDKAEKERDKARDRIAELEKQLAEFQKPKVQDTFEAHGLTWIKHVPGDPRPCDRETEVRVLYDREKAGDYWHVLDQARVWNWSNEWEDDCQITGWNYADAP